MMVDGGGGGSVTTSLRNMGCNSRSKLSLSLISGSTCSCLVACLVLFAVGMKWERERHYCVKYWTFTVVKRLIFVPMTTPANVQSNVVADPMKKNRMSHHGEGKSDGGATVVVGGWFVDFGTQLLMMRHTTLCSICTWQFMKLQRSRHSTYWRQVWKET